MSFPKRSAEDFRDDQGGKRQKSDKDALSTPSLPSSPPKSVVLSPDEHYIVEIEGLGRLNLKDNWFRFGGGSNVGLKLNDAVFMTKVAVSDSHGTQIFCGEGGDHKLVSIRRNQKDGTTTVSLEKENNNKIVSNSGLPEPPVEMQISRNKVVNVHGIQSATITAGDGGHVIHNGCGLVSIEGNVQSVNLHGTGSVRINGNVEEGLNLGGLGYMVVYGNVRGDIQVNGVSSLTVFGKHLGAGNLSKGWLAKVRFLEEDEKNGNDAPPEVGEEPQAEEEEDKTEYDEWKWEEMIMDVMSDDEDGEEVK